MRFIFEKIPEQSKFAIFELGQKGPAEMYEIPSGDTEIGFDIPSEWEDPHYAIKTISYYIPDDCVPITDSEKPITITGADYYLDVTQNEEAIERNWKSVESLIVAIGSSGLEPRQKFFTGLLSLNSYFEFLVHAMLVLSGHISNNRFRDLGTHENRISEAFSDDNTAFFGTAFELCPGKSIDTAEVPLHTRAFLVDVMNDVRKLRNEVAHKWGYRDVPEERIKSLFEVAGIALPYTSNPDAFFEGAAQQFTAIWAKVKNPLDLRYKLVAQREVIRKDRTERGYA